MAIVTRTAARELKARIRARETIAELGLQQASAGVDPPDLRSEIDALPVGQRAALALFYLDGLSVAEVATALAIPPGTVKTRLMTARNRLRALLEGQNHGQA